MILASFLFAATPQNLGWHQEFDFRVQRIEWNVTDSVDMHNRCALTFEPWRKACVVRIVEGGQCIVYSTLTQEEAKRVYLPHEGWSLYQHEVEGHCGKGTGKAWGHK